MYSHKAYGEYYGKGKTMQEYIYNKPPMLTYVCVFVYGNFQFLYK